MRTLAEIGQDLSRIDDATVERYARYFRGLAPRNPDDVFRRYLFAFLSIQTSWETNVRLYSRLRDLAWLQGSEEDLHRVFVEERCGLHTRRPANLWAMGRLHLATPPTFDRHPMESWQAYRDRMYRTLPGFGLTKIAFVMEMIWPESSCVCLDRHMLSTLFGWRHEGICGRAYRLLERRFVRLCGDRPPGLVRLAFWDSLKGYDSPAYWADCMAT